MGMYFKVDSHAAEALSEKELAIERAMLEMGIAALGFATLKCPVDTSNLRGSLAFATAIASGGGDSPHGTPPKATMVVGTNVEYAIYAERRSSSPFYLRNSISDHVGDYQKILKSHLDGI